MAPAGGGAAGLRRCGELRTRYRRDGFVKAERLVGPAAMREAWEVGASAAVVAGRFGGDPEDLPGSLGRRATLPEGLAEASDLNLIHNGFLLSGMRALWPMILATAAGARCLLGLSSPESLVAEDGAASRSGLRLSAHLRLAPKVAGAEQQHITSHQDASYWAHKFSSQQEMDAFVNGTVTAWVPLVAVDRARGSMTYRRTSHTDGFLGPGTREAVEGLAERRLVQPQLRHLDPKRWMRPLVVTARRGDVLFHHLYTAHGPLRLPRNSTAVRWILELRFHRASVVDQLRLQPMHPALVGFEQLTLGPLLDNLDAGAVYGEVLDMVARVTEKMGPHYGNTRRAALLGSGRRPLRLPAVGLGTGRLLPHEVAPAVAQFLALGGRHVDTAVSYRNHALVAAACRSQGLPPHAVVITTKVWPSGRRATFDAVVQALKELDGSGLVVVLLHWPGTTPAGQPRGGFGSVRQPPADCQLTNRSHDWRRCRAEAFRALVALRDAGLISACGVSNFAPRHLRQLREDLADAASAAGGGVPPRRRRTPGAPSLPLAPPASAPWPPDLLQTEVHPWWREEGLLDFCRAEGIRVVAFGSLGSPEEKGAALADPVVQRVARAEGLSAAQVLLRWAVQLGLHVIPTTTKDAHMREALDVAGPGAGALSANAMEVLGRLPQRAARIYDPDPEDIQ